MASTAGPEFEYQNVTFCSPPFASAFVFDEEPQADSASMGRTAMAAAFSSVDFLMVVSFLVAPDGPFWPPTEKSVRWRPDGAMRALDRMPRSGLTLDSRTAREGRRMGYLMLPATLMPRRDRLNRSVRIIAGTTAMAAPARTTPMLEPSVPLSWVMPT